MSKSNAKVIYHSMKFCRTKKIMKKNHEKQIFPDIKIISLSYGLDDYNGGQ